MVHVEKLLHLYTIIIDLVLSSVSVLLLFGLLLLLFDHQQLPEDLLVDGGDDLLDQALLRGRVFFDGFLVVIGGGSLPNDAAGIHQGLEEDALQVDLF